MFLVHEHCNATSAIDKYWIFPTCEIANEFFIKKIKFFQYYLDLDYYFELNESFTTHEIVFESIYKNRIQKQDENEYICLTENDYLLFACIDSNGFARRP